MKSNSDINFGKIFFKIFMVFLFLSLIGLLFSYSILNESFFLKFSPDGKLKSETLLKIKEIRFSIVLFCVILLVFIILSDRNRQDLSLFFDKHKEFIKNIILLFVVLLFFIMIGEISLRVIIGQETNSAGVGPGSIKFNQNYVFLNSDNMRDINYNIEKEEGTIRVAAIGDSFTFGSGVKDVNKTYSAVLEKLLNEKYPSKNIEVLNFGIPGYDSIDELKVIRDKAMKYNPDIIIIGYVANDLINVDPNLTSQKWSNYEIPYIGFILRNKLYSYYFIESRVNRFLENIGVKENWVYLLNESYSSELNREYNLDIYKQIGNITKENNISVLVVSFPLITNFENYPLNIIDDFAENISIQNNFSYLKILPYYSEYEPNELVVNKYDSHPNELGHEIVAKALLDKFINLKLIKI